MDLYSILTIAVASISSLIGIWTLITLYIIGRFGECVPRIRKDLNYLPTVSIVIPTRNEEMLIQSRLKNISEMDYPKQLVDVVFIDDSTDKTPDIIKTVQAEYSYIRLLKQEKPGFNNALNQGYGAAKGDIVIKSDCDAFPFPDGLRRIVANFADTRVGAVSAVCYFDPSDKRMEKFFRGIQERFKQAEAYFHSALIFNGGFGAYRRHLIPVLPQEVTADDSEIVVNVVKNGYRAIVDPSVKVRFPSPENFSERRKQLDRRAAGVIKIILKNLNMLFNPRFGKFGLITLPMEFFVLVAAPLLLLIDLALVIMLTVLFQPVLAIVIVSLVGLFLLSTRFSVLSRTLVDTYLSCFHGILLSSQKKKTWEKEEEGRRELLKQSNSR